MSIHTDRKDPVIDAIILATFPGYTGKKVQLRSAESVSILNTYWDGGSRYSYAVATLSDHPSGKNLAAQNPPQFGGPGGVESITIQPHTVFVEHTISRGKDLGIRIYVRPDDIAPMLPETTELTAFESIVLYGTACYKASYNGKDRFDHTAWDRRDAGLQDMTRTQWDDAKTALISRKLLNKRGAITNEGRNAIEGWTPHKD